MTYIASLAILACIVLLWLRAARKLAADGRGWLVRNFLAGMIALPVGVILAFMLLGGSDIWTVFGWLLVGGVVMLYRTPLPGDAVEEKTAPVPSSFALSPTAQAIYDAADEPNEQLQRWRGAAPRTARATIADIEFDYRDAKGDDSHRRVDVETVDREYFQGHCHKAGAERTFLIARVRGKVLDRESGELLAPKAWATQAISHPLNDPGRISIGRDGIDLDPEDFGDEDGQIEICFTGYSKADKLRLEEMASSGGMVVRQSVTTGLTHLCAGGKPGPSKLAKAAEVGAEIIDEADFYALYGGAS